MLPEGEYKRIVGPLLYRLHKFLDSESPVMLTILEKKYPERFNLWHGLVNETRDTFSRLRGEPEKPHMPPWHHSDPSKPAVWVPGFGACICKWCVAKRGGAALPKWEAAPPTEVKPDPTVCQETGERVENGVCPTHDGDGCLIYLPEYVKEYNRMREQLFEIKNTFQRQFK